MFLNNRETVALRKMCCTVLEEENRESFSKWQLYSILYAKSILYSKITDRRQSELCNCSGPIEKAEISLEAMGSEIQPRLATQASHMRKDAFCIGPLR